ncbi:unnamed protein product [Closterium sp. NIES-53]
MELSFKHHHHRFAAGGMDILQYFPCLGTTLDILYEMLDVVQLAAALGASASAAPGTGESVAPGTTESAAQGASESALSGTIPTKSLHNFTLDFGPSCSFFRDSTTLTPLSRPVAVSLADPSGGPVLAHSSTVLPCRAAPSGLLSGLHLPSFSTNLVSGADLQDAWVDQLTPRGQRVTYCTCSRTGRHLATFTYRLGSSLYTLTTASPPVTASGQVAASGQVFAAASGQVFAAASRSSPESAPCLSSPLSHETLLWQHRLGHPSLPRLRGMASRTLVSGLPRSLSPLPPGPAPSCIPCVEGRQRAAPHSSSFPSTEAPLQTLHMDMWCPGHVSGQGTERYFLLVVDNYSRYTTVFPLRRKGEVTEVLIDWIRGARRQLSESFGSDLPVLRLHSDRGAFVCNTSADRLSSCAVPCVFLGFPSDAHGWQFYHPTSRRVLSSHDVMFDESVSYYHPAEPVEVAVDSGAARGAEPAGAGHGGAEPELSGGPPGIASRREPLSPQQLREWYARRCRRAAVATGPTAGGASGAGGAAGAAAAGAVGAGAVPTGGDVGAGAVGGPGAAGAVGVVAGDPRAEGTGAVSAVFGGAARPRPYYVPLLQQVRGLPPSTSPTPPLLSPLPVQSLSQLQLASPLPGPSPSSRSTRGHMERCEPESRPALPESCPASPESLPESPVRPVRTSRHVLRQCPPRVPGTHSMTLRPSTAPQHVPLPSPPASSLPALADPDSDSLRTSSPTFTRLLATVLTDHSFESTAASALVAELVEFAAHCHLDYAASLVAESESVCPSSVGGECALGTDVLEDRQEEFECFAAAVPHLVSMLLPPEGDPDAPDIPTPHSYAEAIEGPYSSQWQAAMDAEMASWKSTGTYVDEVPSPWANIVSGMWIFRVKRPPGSPPVFKARYVARGFIQRQGVDSSRLSGSVASPED